MAKVPADQILAWARARNLAKLRAHLVSGRVHGKPGLPVAELDRIEKVLAKALDDGELYELGKRMLGAPEYSARNLGVGFVERGWPKHRDVQDWIRRAADDEDWIVREYAAGVFARLLERDFPHFSKLFRKWVETESVNVKRAIALAVKYDARNPDPKRWPTYRALLEPLLGEAAEYIQKNLGPFAIGDGLLSRFPEEILGAAKQWARSPNENVRWNVAMIFTAAAARPFAKAGRALLAPLTEDASPRVRRAAQRALKKLGT